MTEDWSRFVPEGDPEARFGVAPVDVDRLGLRPALEAFLAPAEPEAKEAPKSANKAAPRPSTK